MPTLSQLAVLAQVEPVPSGSSLLPLLWFSAVVVVIISCWITFEKADEPGWATLIPVFNLIILARVAGRPAWWGLLLLIPIVNVVVWFALWIGVARRFGHGAGLGVGSAVLPIVFLPILAASTRLEHGMS